MQNVIILHAKPFSKHTTSSRKCLIGWLTQGHKVYMAPVNINRLSFQTLCRHFVAETFAEVTDRDINNIIIIFGEGWKFKSRIKLNFSQVYIVIFRLYQNKNNESLKL